MQSRLCLTSSAEHQMFANGVYASPPSSPSQHTLTQAMTIKQHKEALRQLLLERLKEDISNPESWQRRLQHSADVYVADTLIGTRPAMLRCFAEGISDCDNVSMIIALYAYCLCTEGPLPADELCSQATLFTRWKHIVLQRWWRSWIKYRRFKRFISHTVRI
jgi:hypothetical protein